MILMDSCSVTVLIKGSLLCILSLNVLLFIGKWPVVPRIEELMCDCNPVSFKGKVCVMRL